MTGGQDGSRSEAANFLVVDVPRGILGGGGSRLGQTGELEEKIGHRRARGRRDDGEGRGRLRLLGGEQEARLWHGRQSQRYDRHGQVREREGHEKNEARVIPVILRTCDWSEMPYAKLQALPTGAKPISSFADKDEAYTDAAKGIRMVVDYMISQGK